MHLQEQHLSGVRLTVITVCYNDLAGLRRTIPSVVSQTRQDFEFIVVDGGSTDGSLEYIQSQTRIDRWVSERDGGIYNAMNKGVGMAHGTYCIFMNAGDHFFAVNTLEQVIPLLQDKDYYCGQAVMIEGDKAETFIPPADMTRYYQINDTLCHQSLFTRTTQLKKRPYSEQLSIVSDWKQFFESWFFDQCSYQALPCIVAVFYRDGLSSVHVDKLIAERAQTLAQMPHEATQVKETREQKEKRRKEKLQKEINKSMAMKPIARDWNIAASAFRFLIKDLFH